MEEYYNLFTIFSSIILISLSLLGLKYVNDRKKTSGCAAHILENKIKAIRKIVLLMGIFVFIVLVAGKFLYKVL